MGVTIASNVNSFPGVYAIWNKCNGKIYIGSSKNIKNRALNHLGKLKKKAHPITDMQNDFNSGDEMVIFNVLKVNNVKNLRYYEREAITSFKSIENGYNCQSVSSKESVELNKIRILSGTIDYFHNGADQQERNLIYNKIIHD